MSRQHGVYPYLRVHSAAAAIAFYGRAFGASEIFRLTPSGRIGHAEIRIGPARLMLSDEYPEHGIRAPRTLGGASFSIHLHVTDVDEAFEQAPELHGGVRLRLPSPSFVGAAPAAAPATLLARLADGSRPEFVFFAASSRPPVIEFLV